MAGVYNLNGLEEELSDLSTDDQEDRAAQETELNNYDELSRRLCGLIDDNIAYLAQYLDNMKLTSPQDYERALTEYEEVAIKYNNVAELAMTEGRSALPEEQQGYIDELQKILDFTAALTEQIKKTGWTPAETRLAEEGTAMVKHEEPASGEVVVMKNVGIVRAWWEKLNPELRTIIKAAAVGGAIYGGSELYKRFVKK